MRKAWLLAILSAGLVMAAKAQDDSSPSPAPSPTAKPPTVTRMSLSLSDGSHVIGTAKIHTIGLVTDYATLKLQVSGMRDIKLTGSDSAAAAKLGNGDSLTGHLDVKDFHLDTIFGSIDVPIAVISEIQISNSGGAFFPDGLVLHYTFSGGGDKVTDSSGTGADGKVNGATYVPDAKPAGGETFNGVNQSVDLDNQDALQLQNLTIALWMKRDNTNNVCLQNSMAELFGYGTHGYSFGLFSNGQLYLTKMEVGNVQSSAAVTDQSGKVFRFSRPRIAPMKSRTALSQFSFG